jgi:hypothetical protein
MPPPTPQSGAPQPQSGGFTIIPNCPSCGTQQCAQSFNPDTGQVVTGCDCTIPDPAVPGAFVQAGFWAVISVEADNLPSADPEGFRNEILAGKVYLDPETGIPVFDLNIDWQADDCTGSGDICFGLNEEIASAITSLEAEGYTIVDAGIRCGPSAGPFTQGGAGPGGCPVGEFYSIQQEACFPQFVIPPPLIPPPPNPPNPPNPPPVLCKDGSKPPCLGYIDCPPMPMASDGNGFAEPNGWAALPVHPTVSPANLRAICGACADAASGEVSEEEIEI